MKQGTLWLLVSLGVLAQTTAIGRTRVAAQPNTGGTGCKTGRINRWSEAALKSAVEMLATTNDQKFKANLIRTILDYEVRQQERAESNKAARRKRAENTELAELRSKVAELSAQVDSANNSRAEEISRLRACLKETAQIVSELRSDLGSVKGEADTARRDINRMQESLKLTNGIIEQLATALPPEKRNEFASELFQKFKPDERELLAQLFKSMKSISNAGIRGTVSMEKTLSQWYESSSALKNMDQKSYLSCGRSSWAWALRWTR